MNTVTSLPAIRLLLVDDDQVDRLAIKRSLTQSLEHEFRILEAETGEQGLILARAEKPDCILLDYHLPDLNGVDFLAELAEETGELPMPVVMLTGADNAVVAVDALKRGARDYVVKDTEQGALQWLPAVILRALREQQTIKEKVEAVEKLREAEAKYRTLVEQIPAITYIASIEAPGNLLYISPQILKLGYPHDAWLDDPQGLFKRIHPKDRDLVIEEFTNSREQQAPLRCEYRIITYEGRTRWFLDEANVVRDDTGRPLFLQGILVDITQDKENEQELEYYRRRLEELVAQRTAQLEKQSELLRAANANMVKDLSERKRAEAALRASEARFRLLLDSAGEGIYGLDTEGRCIFVNYAALKILGYTGKELIGQDIHEKIHHSRADRTPYSKEECHIYDAFRTGVCYRSSETVWRKDGSSLLAEYSSYPMLVEGRITGAVLVFRKANENGVLE
jgi:PAS domain S-box-containing protein